MSNSEILYVKGMNISESDEGSQSDDNMWDDTQLKNAYDKALGIANVEVAKRIAMATNNRMPKADSKDKSGKSKSKTGKKRQWAAGAPCRAVYEADGRDYEAYVLRLINDKECVVKFLGYDNSEIVALESMQPSRGRDAQKQQIQQAMLEKDDDGSDTSHSDMDITSQGSTEKSFQRKNKPKRKNSEPKQTIINGFELPNMLPMPNLGKRPNLGSMDMPIPPPPLPFLGDSLDGESQAISSMLLSWYMSGYYTGLYKGLERSRQDRKRKH